MQQHKNPGGVAKKYGLKRGTIKYDNMTKEVARGLEQTLMVYYHSRKWMGENGFNKINGISPKNDNKDTYYNETVSYLENQIDNEYLNFIEEQGSWWQ